MAPTACRCGHHSGRAPGHRSVVRPPAWADDDPHSPADRTVPVPETWEPGEADTDPSGGDPPEEPWTPPGTETEAAPQGEETLADTCANWGNGGIQDWYPLERHQVSDRLELAVNTATGNLLLQHRNLTTAGTGLDLSVSSFYNSTDGQDGWTLSHGRDVGLQIFSNSLIFQGPSGYCERFDVEGEGSFTSPAGLNADLEELDNGHYALTFHRGEYADQVWTFTAQGWWYSQADRNGHTHRMRYDPEGDLASVVDTQDRVTTVDWENWYQPGSITDPTGLSNVPAPQAACWGATIYMLKLSAASAVLGVGGTPVHIAMGVVTVGCLAYDMATSV
ncbi:DUF6531 domain-containing protein [Nocardiopsis kunsanensis]|uniref:DUF6531 domain-containing protein n=1 Tax=Nocardiopsis kunsanensis TaxID=141693 RepID=UPI0003460693|nr:DUF6531 domain-containing protein [Nocardiopsis kunsanensis]